MNNKKKEWLAAYSSSRAANPPPDELNDTGYASDMSIDRNSADGTTPVAPESFNATLMNAIPGISSSDLLPALEIQTIAIADGPAFIAPNTSTNDTGTKPIFTGTILNPTELQASTSTVNPSSAKAVPSVADTISNNSGNKPFSIDSLIHASDHRSSTPTAKSSSIQGLTPLDVNLPAQGSCSFLTPSQSPLTPASFRRPHTAAFIPSSPDSPCVGFPGFRRLEFTPSPSPAPRHFAKETSVVSVETPDTGIGSRCPSPQESTTSRVSTIAESDSLSQKESAKEIVNGTVLLDGSILPKAVPSTSFIKSPALIDVSVSGKIFEEARTSIVNPSVTVADFAIDPTAPDKSDEEASTSHPSTTIIESILLIDPTERKNGKAVARASPSIIEPTTFVIAKFDDRIVEEASATSHSCSSFCTVVNAVEKRIEEAGSACARSPSDPDPPAVSQIEASFLCLRSTPPSDIRHSTSALEPTAFETGESGANLDGGTSAVLVHCETFPTAEQTATIEETIHHKYWDCKEKMGDKCPECGERFHCGWSRRTHYLQLHYDRYFESISHHEANAFVGKTLGSQSEVICHLKQWTEDYCYHSRFNDHPASRVCLLCKETPKASRLYNGPRRLLAHVEKEHPVVARDLKKGYKELCSRGQHVSNAMLHELLSSPLSSFQFLKRKADEEKFVETPTKIQRT